MPGINTLEFATKFTGVLEKALVEKSQIGFMTDNAMRAHFVGAKTVKIPNIDMQSLGNYDREAGFARGSVTVTNSTYELEQDRARTFTIDREDMDETGVASLAGEVMSEFVRTKVVPEMDSYVLSKLAGFAIEKNQKITTTDYPLSSKAFAAFLKLEESIRNKGVSPDEELVVYLPWTIYSTFITSPEISKFVTVSDFKSGEINLKVKKINGISLFPVSDEKMWTEYRFLTGEYGNDQEAAGGFVKTEAAQKVSMLMLPKKACSLVKKSEKIRIFTPDQNLNADAYKFDYRIYYDAFIKNAYSGSVWALI